MKKTLITLAFAVASMPMFAANQAGQANPPASNTATPDTKASTKTTKKHTKKASKKSAKKDSTTTPVAK